MKTIRLILALLAASCILPASLVAAQPNILWLTSEDHGPEMGCYGDKLARTPNVDALAAQGMLFKRAWSTAPVCAPARTAIISGIYPASSGGLHMRSMVSLPAGTKMYPQFLREAGYYCTNNSKTDYNLREPGQVWDASSNKAHWKHRAPGQPFFAIFNSTKSHESQLRTRPHTQVTKPEDVRVPAYHPDTPEVRRDWAQYYDQVSEADADAGRQLRELADAGLADETIVFYYGDHGSGMPRSKRWPSNSGLHVPLVVYFPAKWRHLAPQEYQAGGVSDRLVGFVDLAPTVLSLAGIRPPDWMQGRAFAGPHQTEPQPYLFGERGRMDERMDLVRSVTDGRYVYLRNYHPHVSQAQRVAYQFETPTTRVWHDLFTQGKTTEAQSQFWRVPKAVEELYDLATDRDEVQNLARSPEHRAILGRLRDALRRHLAEVRDVCFLPEPEMHARAADRAPYELARDADRYPFEQILATADLASNLDPGSVPQLTRLLADRDGAVRYWAALGLLMRGRDAVAPNSVQLAKALADSSPSVRIVAAQALAEHGDEAARAKALDTLGRLAVPKEHGVLVAMSALAAIEALGPKAAFLHDRIGRLAPKGASPDGRYNSYVPRLIANLAAAPPNVLFIISDDLTATALSCYGNRLCQTPNIDRLAAQGTRFTRAFCNATYCGPSRASFLSGYYPHATGVLGYTSPRPAIGDRPTWPQSFKNAGYHTARVSKIFHMGVPGEIEEGGDGADDPASWSERFNSPGPEWKAPGIGETLEGNPDGKKPVVGGNTFVVVEADGDDRVHSDGKTAAKAVELIRRHAGTPFFLAVGFVRPHVPFVAPKKYFEPFLPYDKLTLPPKAPADWDDIPQAGINYKTSANMKMDLRRQQKAIGGYYASVAYMDAQVGQVLDALEQSGQAGRTIVIFTSDHGYHLGEHDFWAKVSLRDESAKVPLIVRVPGKQPAVCHSLVELLDLYPTIAGLCGLEVPARLQGRDISRMFDDPAHRVRDAVLCVAPSSKGFLLREDDWAYLQYAEDASQGIELFDMKSDPQQFTNLAGKPEFAPVVDRFKTQLAAKLRALRNNDLPRN